MKNFFLGFTTLAAGERPDYWAKGDENGFFAQKNTGRELGFLWKEEAADSVQLKDDAYGRRQLGACSSKQNTESGKKVRWGFPGFFRL